MCTYILLSGGRHKSTGKIGQFVGQLFCIT